MGTKTERTEKAKKSAANLTVVPTTESTPKKEGAIMVTAEKDQLKKDLAELKEKEKALKADVKVARQREKDAKAAAKAAGLTNGFSRADATVEFINSMGPSTLEEIIAGANKVYYERKGTEKANNLKEAKSVANFSVQVLVGVGSLSLKNDKYIR